MTFSISIRYACTPKPNYTYDNRAGSLYVTRPSLKNRLITVKKKCEIIIRLRKQLFSSVAVDCLRTAEPTTYI